MLTLFEKCLIINIGYGVKFIDEPLLGKVEVC